MNKQKLIMMIGVAGSGKSTIAAGYEDKDTIIVSSDDIREEFYGDASIQTDHARVFAECHRRIHRNLKEGKNVVFDATNLSSKRRKGFLREFQKYNCEFHAVVVVSPIEDIRERMMKRERKVPMNVVYEQIKKFQCPAYFEGWHAIHLVQINCGNEEYVEYMDIALHTPHDNHHHRFNVGEHILRAVQYYHEHMEQYGMEEILLPALYYHDIGKPFVKTNTNKKGEYSEEAHYYGHQNYSAYLYLIMARPQEGKENTMWLIANLIQYHMEPYLRSEESLYKFYNETGLGPYIKLIHECDRAAH